MKKMKEPGDNISLKTRKNEAPIILSWINSQTNLMDSIRYLIEKEIAEHGVRNLQSVIPMERRILNEASYHMNHYSQELVTITYKEKAGTQNEVDDEIDEEDIESWA